MCLELRRLTLGKRACSLPGFFAPGEDRENNACQSPRGEPRLPVAAIEAFLLHCCYQQNIKIKPGHLTI